MDSRRRQYCTPSKEQNDQKRAAAQPQGLVHPAHAQFLSLRPLPLPVQGGAGLGYLMLNRRDAKTRELCIPSFISVLFGITEPALFGVNLRFRFPLIAGCIGGAIGGLVVYFTDLAALGFGTTVVPGIALADPSNNGYVSYIIAHVIALAAGFIMTLIIGAGAMKKARTAAGMAGSSANAGPASQQSQAQQQTQMQ